jgi:ubiquitin-like domain-containing CTD phosphatase 1
MDSAPLEVNFHIKWSGKDYEIALPIDSTIMDLKLKLFDETNVPPDRQKLLGLKAPDGKLAGNEVKLAILNLKAQTKVMMMGTPLSDEPEVAEDETVVDDIGVSSATDVDVKDRPENLEKIDERVKSYQFKQLNAPRPGKKLLVLDIDYTIFDHRSSVERITDLMRPHLHEFLTAVYPFYDIFIWSATSLFWIEVKMTQLGVLSSPNYKISTLVDYGAMITVDSPKYGVFNAKPLKVIWDRFSEFYNPENTIMFDDLGRNFIMNPQNGLKIAPFKNAPVNKAIDQELVYLKHYLLLIAELGDLSSLNHRKWRSYLAKGAK